MTSKELNAITDFADVRLVDGQVILTRKKDRGGLREEAWTADLMGQFDNWRDLVGLDEAAQIGLEVSFAPGGLRSRAKNTGFCRADAIVTHPDGRISIIEAKISGEPTSICGGIGQLIYYQTLARQFWGAEIASLVLASRYFPEFVAEAMVDIKAPIRFLKATDCGSFYGLIPDYGRVQ